MARAARRRKLRDAWTRTARREQITAALRPRLAALRGLVLDIGGGRGAPHDDAWGPEARRFRVDLSPVHRPDVRADAQRLAFRDSSADAVVMVELLEHVPSPWLVLEEAHRVLGPGGRLVGTVPFVAPVHGDPGDYYRYSADGLRHLLSAFQQVEVVPLGNHYGAAWSLLSARSRVFRLANPLLRRAGTRPDPRCPQGYLFTAVKR